MIDVRDLQFAYPDGRVALDGLTLHAEPGESVGLIGPNGAGKTTLFLCMCGVLRAQKGSIRVTGFDPVDAAQRKQLPAHVGVVFQNSDDQLFSSTVGEDVAFGPLNLGLPTSEVRSRVAESLNKVGMTGQDDRVPFHLSGGEKRRAAIAGVLAMHAEVLLLDEPSMFLDPRGRRELIRLINDLPGTKLIASHDLALVRDTCSRVVLLDAGCVVACGGVDLLHDAKLMETHGLEAV
ncbi:MAG TPA: ABC transporter ATP-binding protein [Gemmataceae bacterium]|jgi:cobalt/nickel transport system ATP-binding protein|nr:ABC transporter ATP-binding protein [Gemmataceae bacterium]